MARTIARRCAIWSVTYALTALLLQPPWRLMASSDTPCANALDTPPFRSEVDAYVASSKSGTFASFNRPRSIEEGVVEARAARPALGMVL